MDIYSLRKEYRASSLEPKDLEKDPFKQFEKWFLEVQKAAIEEPNAMALATVNGEGHPTCRMVLLKKWDQNGFVFFTNKESKKGHDLMIHPFAAATFFWRELERQVRIEGSIETVSGEETAEYFSKRPRKSQIAAWASHQSDPLRSREELIQKYEEIAKKYEGQDIPVPPFWKGYRIKPVLLEFWQGRESRLHDRFEYHFEQDNWIITRLSP